MIFKLYIKCIAILDSITPEHTPRENDVINKSIIIPLNAHVVNDDILGPKFIRKGISEDIEDDDQEYSLGEHFADHYK